MTVYLDPLPTDEATLIDQIATLEVYRERLRDLGRLSPERAKQIASELTQLRGQLALVRAQRLVSRDCPKGREWSKK